MTEQPVDQSTLAVGQALTPKDRDIADELSQLDPNLAGMYAHAVAVLPRIHEPGMAYVIAGLGREISRGVLDRLLSEEGAIVPSAIELSDEMATEQNRRTISAVLGLPPEDPLVTLWFRVPKDFSNWMKYRYPGPPVDVVRAGFEAFRDLLFGRVGPYFATQTELDTFLAIEEPSDQDIERVQRFLLRQSQRRYFFDKLGKSGWAAKLYAAGFFKNPPDRIVSADGTSWSARTWPEGRYLVRVAEEVAEIAVKVICELPTDNTNPVVWDHAAEAARQIPPSLGRKTVRTICQGIASTVRIFPDSAFQLVKHLADGGYKEAFELAAYLLFIPGADDLARERMGDGRFSALYNTDWMVPRLESYELGEFINQALPSLEALDVRRTVGLLVGRIRRIAQLVDTVEGGEMGYLSWSTFRGQDDDAGESVPSRILGALVDALSRYAPASEATASDALKQVQAIGGEFGRRLSYIVLSLAGQHLPTELEAFFASENAVEPGLPAREVAAVVREQFRNGSFAAKLAFQYAVQRGPSAQHVHAMASLDKEGLTHESIRESTKWWQTQRLTWFRGEIPDEFRNLAEELGIWGKVPSHREQELAEVGSYIGGFSWGEPSEPLDLTGHSAEDVVELSTQRKDAVDKDARAEAGRLYPALEAYASRHPYEALEAANRLLLNDSPEPIRHLISGLRTRVGDGSEVPWSTVFGLGREIIDRSSVDVSGTGEGWTRATAEVLEMIEAACNRGTLTMEQMPEIWTILGDAVTHAPGWPVRVQPSAESLEQLVGSSLPSLRGQLIRAIVAAGFRQLYAPNNEGETDAPTASGSGTASWIGKLLSQLFERDERGRPTLEAVVGRYVPQVQRLDREWLVQNSAVIFRGGATDPAERPAWAAYLIYNPVYDAVFSDLRAWYLVAAESDTRLAIESDRYRSLARALWTHVVSAHLRGLIELSDEDQLLQAVTRHVPAAERGHAYWAVFRGWSDASTPPSQAAIGRLSAFWEWRLDELGTIGDPDEVATESKSLVWFMRAPHVPDEARIRLGLRTLELTGGETGAPLEWSEIGRLAHIDPERVYRMVELLVGVKLRTGHAYVRGVQVKPVLGTLLTRLGAASRQRAVRLIHRLGEQGLVEFGELLTMDGPHDPPADRS